MDAGAPRTETEERRAHLLATALRLFGEHGVAAVGMRQVARAAGVSLGGLQHHFRTKRDLEQAVLGDVMNGYRREQGPALEAETFAELLAAGFRGQVAWARANPNVVALGARLALEDPHHEWPGEHEMNEELIQRIRDAQTDRVLRSFDPRLFIAMLEALLNAWTAHRDHYARHLQHLDASTLDDAFCDFAVNALLDGIRPRD
ncbi:MAG: TetR/AcrR family transcriptional regulator [Myxococcota bacterium]